MEARKLYTFVFFLILAFAAQESMGKTCGILLKENSCVNDETCRVQCVPLGYPIGLCLIGGAVPRQCNCIKTDC
ncbi:hypothetical protein ABFS83_02G123400 [Erythranthe nasuta]